MTVILSVSCTQLIYQYIKKRNVTQWSVAAETCDAHHCAHNYNVDALLSTLAKLVDKNPAGCGAGGGGQRPGNKGGLEDFQSRVARKKLRALSRVRGEAVREACFRGNSRKHPKRDFREVVEGAWPDRRDKREKEE